MQRPQRMLRLLGRIVIYLRTTLSAWAALPIAVPLAHRQSSSASSYYRLSLEKVAVRLTIKSINDLRKRVRANFDVVDEQWLGTHENEADLSLKVLEAASHCGWQVIGPDLAEQPAPAGWPWPLAGYDYQNGEYKVRDYIVSGMRDY